MGEAIRVARESRGQSQADVAFALKCATHTVWRWEKNLVKPRGYYMRQLQTIYPELARASS